MASFQQLLDVDYIDEFGDYLDTIISSRKGHNLRPSSKATYRSSITMILRTYLFHKTEKALFDGHLDQVLELEHKHGNNANFSMQSCAIRHFKAFVLSRHEPEWIQSIVPTTICGNCLCGCDICHDQPVGCGVVECFGKCGKLYAICRMRAEHSTHNEPGVCKYCVDKYFPLFSTPHDRVSKKKKARHIEYVNDHALVGRSISDKFARVVSREILKNSRWHCLPSHRCEHPKCSGWHP